MKIYTVDDNDIILGFIAELLTENFKDADVKIFCDSKVAYKTILNDRPEIVITDQAMPIMDGVYMTKLIYEVYRPVTVLISAMNSIDTKMFDFFIRKPYENEDFVDIVHLAIKEVQTRKENKILDNIECTIKDKIFLKKVINVSKDIMFEDQDVPQKSLYATLSDETNQSQDAIRKHISKIRKKSNFSNLGNIDFIKQLLNILKR